MKEIFIPNANSRETYFTMHNIREAHRYSKGKGVKVGVIDWLFAADDNKSLYAGTVDLTGESYLLHESNGHGLWMATVLREIAPECEIYAINAVLYDSDEIRNELFVFAIDWAIENGIDILTYSHMKLNAELTGEAISKAVQNGIITTFIHNENPDNIWCGGCMPYYGQGFSREPDINIYHYDYNHLFIEQYEKYKDENIKSGNDIPYFSFSSMSPVTGGFVAILKSIKPSLTPSECKKILMNTSYPINERIGEHWYDIDVCPRAADIGKAVKSII